MWGTLWVVVYILTFYVLLKKPLSKLVNLNELERTYKQISRKQRILNFILSILMFLTSFAVLIASIKFVGAIL